MFSFWPIPFVDERCALDYAGWYVRRVCMGRLQHKQERPRAVGLLDGASKDPVLVGERNRLLTLHVLEETHDRFKFEKNYYEDSMQRTLQIS